MHMWHMHATTRDQRATYSTPMQALVQLLSMHRVYFLFRICVQELQVCHVALAQDRFV